MFIKNNGILFEHNFNVKSKYILWKNRKIERERDRKEQSF